MTETSNTVSQSSRKKNTPCSFIGIYPSRNPSLQFFIGKQSQGLNTAFHIVMTRIRSTQKVLLLASYLAWVTEKELRNMLVPMECKKQFFFKFLPLCRGQWPRPSAKKGPLPRAIPLPSAKIHWKNSGTFLCRGSWLEALGKDFFLKKLKFLCRGPAGKPSAKIFF